MTKEKDPTALLAKLVKKLRNRYLARKLIEFAALAITMELFLGLVSYVIFLQFKTNLNFPFFLEIFLTILIFRQLFRSRQYRFCLFLDREFSLKDRLYSYLWYAHAGNVEGKVRRAQAEECLRSVDFKAIDRMVRPRIPPLLIAVLPLFLAVNYYYLNVDYRPPFPITRTILRITAPQTDLPSSSRFSGGKENGDPLSRDSDASPSDTGDRDAGLTEEDPSPESPASEMASSAGNTGDERIRDGSAGGGTELEAGSGPSARPEAADAQNPGPIQSKPVSEEISEAVPPSLSTESSFEESLFGKPEHFLSLFPWPEGDPSEDLGALFTEHPNWDLDDYPVRYREHIETYYKELITWQRKNLEILENGSDR